jgi:group I intron endonuclease
MTFCIYTIQNKINNKVYVGKSNNPEIRWGVHKKVASGGKEKYPDDFFAIHGALAKYGVYNFTFKIIEEFADEKECLEAEVRWIEYLKSHDRAYGYNLSLGGDGASPTEETKRKMSEAQRGEKHSHAILTEALVIEILEKYSTGDYTQTKLSKEYGVNRGTIGDIVGFRTWKHIPRPVLSKKVHSLEQSKKLFVRNGEAVGSAKMTKDSVKEAIKLYATGQYTYKQIAEMFNVKPHTIGAIVRGTNWKHIERN